MAGFNGNISVVQDGLILYLDGANSKSFTSGSTSWIDLSGNGNNAILYGSPIYNNINGGNIYFNGVNNSFNVPSLSNTNFPQSEGTISIWVNPNTLQSLKILFDNYNTLRNHIFIRFGSSNQLQFSLHATDNSYKYVFDCFNFTIGSWNNIVLVYKTGVSNFVKIYMNTILVNSGTISSTTFVPDGQVVGTSSGTSNQGNYGVYSLYNRALSSDEITQNYNALRSRYNL